MFREFFRFESRFRFRSLMFWIFSLLFFGLTLLVTGWDETFLPGAGGKIARNAPFGR